MFTGSVSENRVSVGLPPLVRQVLYDEARRIGMKSTELIRLALLDFARQIEARDAAARGGPANAIADFVRTGRPPASTPVADFIRDRERRDA
jgi:hypothetical protein